MQDKSYDATRRATMQAGLALVASGIITRPAYAKATQKGVQYVTESKKPNQSCANCKNLIAPNMCNLVDGEITQTGWCLIWAAKKA